MSMITVDKNNFKQEVLEADMPVLVDFWAEWCMPCKMLAPTVHEVAEEVDSVKFCSYNIDCGEEIPVSYGAQSIPTLMLFYKGEVKRVSVGGVSKQQILDLIDVL